LAVLLSEPQHWHDVQQHVQPEDFTDELRRELAVRYWNHQRDEGEPNFAEFLATLERDDLSELAVALLDSIEALDPDQTLRDALDHMAQAKRRKNERKLVAELRRTSSEPDSDADQVQLLRRLQEQARQPDLRRVVS
jgi:hypothetical protein